MKLSNKIIAVLLAMTLVTSQGMAWDDEKKKDSDNKRKFIAAGLVTVGVVVAVFGGYKVWKYFDLGKMFKKKAVDAEEYIGIDLGTSKSGGGRGDDLVADEHGKTMTASAVQFDEHGKAIKNGDNALNEDDGVTSAKRIIGTPYNRAKEDDILKVVKDDRTGNEHMAAIETSMGKIVSPEKVAAEVLRGVKQRADKHYNKDFKKVVITVPAYFYEFQKAATKRAAKAAGFDEVTLINEPTAAAFAHGAAELNTKKLKEGVNYLVYDFGGGTFDVSIVTAKLEKKQRTFKVISIAGDPRLGGDDIDKKIVEKFAEDLNLDLDGMTDKDKRILHRKAEEAKVYLSDANNVTYRSEFKLQDTSVQVELGIDDFNKEIEDIIARTIDKTDEAIQLAESQGLKRGIDDIHEVVLVGGSSRNLKAREELVSMFGEARLEKSLNGEIDPDEMVAKGAAKYAKVLDEQSDAYHLSDIVPISFRVDVQTGKGGKKYSKVVVPRFAATPTEGTVEGSALGDAVRIDIRQGESTNPDDNVLLGVIDFKGSKEGNTIEIMYDIDNDGLLNVIAKDTVTGKEEKLLIDISKTPVEEELDEIAEEVADQVRHSDKLTKQAKEQEKGWQEFLAEALKGSFPKELVEELQNMAKNQEEVRELLNKVLKDNEITRAELKEVKELLTKYIEAS